MPVRRLAARPLEEDGSPSPRAARWLARRGTPGGATGSTGPATSRTQVADPGAAPTERWNTRIVGPALFKEALSALLHQQHELAIVEHEPQLVVWCTAGRDALSESLPEVRQIQPACVVAVGAHTRSTLRALSRLRVQVFVGSDDGVSVLLQALRAAQQGQPYCSPSLFPALLQAMDPNAEDPHAPGPDREGEPWSGSLSERELQVAVLAASGLLNKQIATRLSVTVPTVKFHLGNVFGKLRVQRRAQLRQFLLQFEQLQARQSATAAAVMAPPGRG